MTNALPRSEASPTDESRGAGDWQQLRGELNSLLAGSAADVHLEEPAGHPPSAQETGAPEATDGDEERHKAALASVNRAVARLREREEPPAADGDSNLVRAAIAEIRARQGQTGEAGISRIRPQTPFAALANAIGAANDRLGEIENQLKVQSGTGPNIKAITAQIAEITRVVELLAAAVGESGQTRRIEEQIEALAVLIARDPPGELQAFSQRLEDLAASVQILSEAHGQHSAQIENFAGAQERQTRQIERLASEASAADFSHLTRRLDEVAATMERLADLQIQQVQQLAREAKEAPQRQEKLSGGLNSIEAAVRSVYDRIDEIETRAAGPSAELEALTEAMAKFTATLEAHGGETAELVPLIEAIGERLDRLEAPEAAMVGLRADVGALRQAVVEALEPRFESIETQIGALAERIAERQADPAVAQMESQVRQLVARMDQTGEHLETLARLQAMGETPAPEALADLVAERTREAIAGLAPTVGKADLSETALAEIEAIFARMINQSERREAEPEPTPAPVPQGSEDVDERLARLESSLAARLANRPSPEAPSARDRMPRNPEADAPLVDHPFGDPPAASVAGGNGPAREQRTEPALSVGPISEDAFAFDAELVTRPPRPVSSLQVGPAENEVTPRSSRNAFIEAHRAAQQAAAARRGSSAIGAGSIIGRALARFQNSERSETAMPIAPEPVPEVVAEPAPERLSRKERRARERAAEAGRQAALQAVALKAATADEHDRDHSEAAFAADADADAENEAPRESFLMRHRKPILLGASVVAIAALGANLVAQRMSAHEPGVTSDAGGAAGTAAPAAAKTPVSFKAIAALPAKPRVPPRPDPIATGSIDRNDAAAMPARIPTTAMLPPSRTVGELAAAAALGSAPPAAPEVAALPGGGDALAPAGTASGPVASPVKVEMPPEGIGPEALRKAAANGDPRAQFEVAAIYTEGKAVPEDLKAASIWYERAAAQGFAPAEYRLASLYENGEGVAKDLEQARLWYERAAEAGNRMSMHNLAALYAGGALGKQDFASAAAWFEKAAELGMTDSQFNLGMLYARGLGVPQNLETSYKWFALAAESGDKGAAKARDDVARSLDADAVKRVQEEVEAWQPSQIDLAANFAPLGTWSDSFNPGDPVTDKSVVSKVQLALDRLGFDVGTPDGLMGPKTSDAIKAFEAATGMSQTGAVNPRLLAVLGSQPV